MGVAYIISPTSLQEMYPKQILKGSKYRDKFVSQSLQIVMEKYKHCECSSGN